MAVKPKSQGWGDIKNQIGDLDKAQLLGLLKDLHAASKEAQLFLHARYSVGGDVLAPYKATISQWINPRSSSKPLSVAKAKAAITAYKKASGSLIGLAELKVFYCEEVFVFLGLDTVDNEAFYDSLGVMFAQALAAINKLPEADREPYIKRMWEVRLKGHEVGWGVWDDFDGAWEDAGLCDLDE